MYLQIIMSALVLFEFEIRDQDQELDNLFVESVNTLKRSCIAKIRASDPRQSLLHRNKLVGGVQNLENKSRISFSSSSSASGSHLFN